MVSASGPFRHLTDGLDATPLEPIDDFFETPTVTEPLKDRAARPLSDYYVDLVPEASHGFAGLLIDCWRDRRTGVLRVQSERGLSEIFFDTGTPILADCTDPTASFGRMLVRTERLTVAELGRAVNACGREQRSDPIRLGEVLVESGLLGAHEVYELMLIHSCDTILSCFAGRRLRARFGPAHDPKVKFAHSVPALVREGIDRHYEPLRVDAILAPWTHRRVKLRSGAYDLLEELGLSPIEQSFVDRLDGRDSLGVASDSTMLPRLHTERLIASLILLDLVDLVPESDVGGMFSARKLSG